MYIPPNDNIDLTTTNETTTNETTTNETTTNETTTNETTTNETETKIDELKEIADQQRNDLQTLTTQIQELQTQTEQRGDIVNPEQLESFLSTGYYAYTFFIVLAVAYIGYRLTKFFMSFITDFLN